MKPYVLIILDGWGIRSEKRGNAIKLANTPVYDILRLNCPVSKLKASGEHVGLPEGFAGNSVQGHLNLGAGRIVKSILTKINEMTESGDFLKNHALNKAIENCKKHNSTLHIMGLLSDEGIYSYDTHLYEILNLCIMKDFINVKLHIFCEGNFEENVEELKKNIEKYCGEVATLSGKNYAMINNWERTQTTYNAIVYGEGLKAESVSHALKEYGKEIQTLSDLDPIVFGNYDGIKDNDSVIDFNFDRRSQTNLAKAFVEDKFEEFEREKLKILFVPFVKYFEGLDNDEIYENVKIAFDDYNLSNTLCEEISKKGLKQLKITEEFRFDYITYYFNGERSKNFEGEKGILIPSHISSPELVPEMRAKEMTNLAIENISNYNFVVINFPNADIVGHTGDLDAAIKAVEFIDTCLGNLLEAIKEKKGIAFITSDHGMAEKMVDDNFRKISIDSDDEVDFIIYNYEHSIDGEIVKGKQIKLKNGILADVAPTILKVMG